MRVVLAASAVLALAACGQPPAESPAPPPAEAGTAEAPVAAAPAAVDGWETAPSAYAKIGTTLPALTGRIDQQTATSEDLRGRWTILGLWPADGAPADEATFLDALSSAVDQDPNLGLRVIHSMTYPSGKWARVYDEGEAAAALGLSALPAYLLIGPDLTIEGYRGALSATPEDGIKPVIWGVAEIRKQVSAPQ